jgi:hypothetical protein
MLGAWMRSGPGRACGIGRPLASSGLDFNPVSYGLQGLNGAAVMIESSVGFRVVLDGVPWTVLTPQRKRQCT